VIRRMPQQCYKPQSMDVLQRGQRAVDGVLLLPKMYFVEHLPIVATGDPAPS